MFWILYIRFGRKVQQKQIHHNDWTTLICYNESMFLAIDYLVWHYGLALKGILNLQRNYITGTWHRFLIARHMRTLFAPWHRMTATSAINAGIGDKFLDAIAGFYFRILAGFIRLSIVLTGLVWLAIEFVFFVLLFIFWLLWPLVAMLFLVRGLILIFG